MIPWKLKFLRAVDRSVGRQLCRMVRPRASAIGTGGPISPDDLQKILVVRPGGLGDAVLTYPMLRALRVHYPGASLDLLAESRNAGVYEIDKLATQIYRYDARPASVFRQLRDNAYDLVIDTEQYHALSAVFANGLAPKFLCGFESLGRSRLQTHSVAFAESTYEASSFLELANAVTGESATFDAERAFITVGESALAWADIELRAAAISKFVALTPGAGGRYRLWSPDRYAEVAQWLVSLGYAVVILGGADGTAAATRIADGLPHDQYLNLAGKTTLAQTAAMLSRARLSVSADTGVMHLAYAVGTPTVSLFGPGLHEKWAPPGSDHRIVRKGIFCSPCTAQGRVPRCPRKIACMRDIGTGEVTAAIATVLD